MAFTLTVGAASNGTDVSLADNTVVPKNGSVTVPYLTDTMITAITNGYIVASPSAPAFTQTSALVITNNVGGTPPTINGVTKAVTFAAVTDIPSATNAINGLVVEIGKLQADIAALGAVQTAIQGELALTYKRDALTNSF